MGKASTFFVITALLVAGAMADQDLDEYGDYYKNYSLSANDTANDTVGDYYQNYSLSANDTANDTVGDSDWLDELDAKITEIVSNATNSSLDCY